MNIGQLIEKLQAFPADLPVLVDGYEGGLTEAKDPVVKSVVFNCRESDYYGPHEEEEYWDPEFDAPGTIRDARQAVVLYRCL